MIGACWEEKPSWWGTRRPGTAKTERKVRRASQSIIPVQAEARPPTERPRNWAKSLLSKNVVRHMWRRGNGGWELL